MAGGGGLKGSRKGQKITKKVRRAAGAALSEQRGLTRRGPVHHRLHAAGQRQHLRRQRLRDVPAQPHQGRGPHRQPRRHHHHQPGGQRARARGGRAPGVLGPLPQVPVRVPGPAGLPACVLRANSRCCVRLGPRSTSRSSSSATGSVSSPPSATTTRFASSTWSTTTRRKRTSSRVRALAARQSRCGQ